MKKVFIIHRWDGNPESDWYSWLQKELTKRGFQVFVPEMPETETPKMEKWVPHISKLVKPNQDTYFVGHSIGCQTILRYLETLKENTKIGGAVLVAGFLKTKPLETKEEVEIVTPWLQTPINFEKVRRACKFTAIFSDDDPYVPLENAQLFKKKLGAKKIIEKSKGHFTEVDGVKELPVVLKELLKMINRL